KLTDDCDKTYSSYSAYGESYNYGYGKKMPARAGDMPIYNHSGPGGGWGMGEERAAYTGNVPSTGFSRQKSLSKTVPKAPGASPKRSAPAETFDKGDRVRHTNFGAGTVLSVKSMGGDILYEVEFDKVGTKKLMASFARLKKED
ncbi:MAG: hypothetical protein PUC29_00295, partial [Clostridia bacterium]|nr:hypothetical protein [Clostridia bacterium]